LKRERAKLADNATRFLDTAESDGDVDAPLQRQTDSFLFRRQLTTLAYEPVALDLSMPFRPDPVVVHPLFAANQRAKFGGAVVGGVKRDARRARALWILPCPHWHPRDCPTVARMQEATIQCDLSLQSAFVDVFTECRCASGTTGIDENVTYALVLC
jgi:hypothetical protein